MEKKITLEEVVKKIEGISVNSWEYSYCRGEDPSPLRGCISHNHSYTATLGEIKIKVLKYHGTRWFPSDYDEDIHPLDFEGYSISFYVNDKLTKEFNDEGKKNRIKPIYERIESASKKAIKEKEKREEILRKGKLEKFLRGEGQIRNLS